MAIGALGAWPLLWASGIVAIVVGGRLLARKRRAMGGTILAVGIVVVLAPFGFLAYSVSPLNWPTTMFVEGLDPPNDPWFTVELRHTRDFRDGTEYHFGNAGDAEHVASAFQVQHPEGVVTLEDPAIMARGGESIWHMSTDDVRYELVHFSDPDWYHLVTQAVVVTSEGSGPDVRIPFPRSAFDATSIQAGQVYTNGWSQDQWDDFYADIDEAAVLGDTITVPTNRDTTATIKLENGLAVITVND